MYGLDLKMKFSSLAASLRLESGFTQKNMEPMLKHASNSNVNEVQQGF